MTAILLPLLVAPGVVFILTFRANKWGRRLPDLHVLVLSLICSVPTHFFLLPWTSMIVERYTAEGLRVAFEQETAIWLVYVIFVAPVALAVLAGRATEWDWLQRALAVAGWTEAARTRSGWNWAFAPEDPAWVLLTLRDGGLLGGKYGAGAFASLDPEARDLYLLEPQAVDESGHWTATGATAAWIPGEEIAMMEFFGRED